LARQFSLNSIDYKRWPAPVHRSSRPPVSTTHTSLQSIESTAIDSRPTLSYYHTELQFRVRGPCLKEVGRYQRGYIYEAVWCFSLCGTGLKRL